MKKIIFGLLTLALMSIKVSAQSQVNNSAKVIIYVKDNIIAELNGNYDGVLFTSSFEDTRSYTVFKMTENGNRESGKEIKKGTGKILLDFQGKSGSWEFDGEKDMSFIIQSKKKNRWEGIITDILYEESEKIEIELILL